MAGAWNFFDVISKVAMKESVIKEKIRAESTGDTGPKGKGLKDPRAKQFTEAAKAGVHHPEAPMAKTGTLEFVLDKLAKKGKGKHQHFTEKTIHDPSKKPEKVKAIYRAVKREHPEYSAEYKARIAFRKGAKSKEERKPGPPYEGPLAGK